MMHEEESEQAKGTWATAVAIVVKNTPLVLILLGTLLVVVGAVGQIPKLGQIGGPRWGYFLAGLGVLMVVSGVGVHLRKHREDDPSTIAKKCGLTITLPRPNSTVGQRIRLEGSCKRKPPEGSLIILEKSPSTSTYWFKKQTPEFDPEGKLWSFSDVYVGGKKDDERIVYLALAGESGRALIDYYFLVRDALPKPIGVRALPKDIVRCAQVAVRRAESDPEPSAREVPIPQRYGLKITAPASGALVGRAIQLSGTYEIKPPEGDLVIYERTLADGLYWFKEEVPYFEEGEKTWSAEIYVGDDRDPESTSRTLYVGVLGDVGRLLRSYFLSIPEQCDNNWAGLKKLSPDIVPLASVNVTDGPRRRATKR
jgi:hypothetical protein